jgi:hypothetical protein
MNVEEFSGSKKRSGGAHRVQTRPFEGPSRKQGFLFCQQKTRLGSRHGTQSGFLIRKDKIILNKTIKASQRFHACKNFA